MLMSRRGIENRDADIHSNDPPNVYKLIFTRDNVYVHCPNRALGKGRNAKQNHLETINEQSKVFEVLKSLERDSNNEC